MKQELSFKIVEKNDLVAIKQNVLFQKISMPPPWMAFWFENPYPSGNSSLTSYFPLQILALQTPPPSPKSLGISSDHPWGGCGYFLELHNVNTGHELEFT